jgi:hypothetical protein
LLCTFWFADNLALQGRYAGAREIFERLLDLRNDVGLLSEEYDPQTWRLVGNFPQAFSHAGLINTACNLTTVRGRVESIPCYLSSVGSHPGKEPMGDRKGRHKDHRQDVRRQPKLAIRRRNRHRDRKDHIPDEQRGDKDLPATVHTNLFCRNSIVA